MKKLGVFSPAVHRLNIAEAAADRAVVRADATNIGRLGLTTAGREGESAVNAVIMDHYTS